MTNRRLEAREARIAANSYREDDHTIEVVWSTGARVIRRPWLGEAFIEELSMDPGAVRLKRLNTGAPFLNSHDSWSLQSVMGKVAEGSAKVENGEGRATIQLSKAERNADIIQDIRDGIIANVSVGYEVHEKSIQEASDGQLRLERATDWEPFEVSAVPMGADPDAHIRSLYARLGGEPETQEDDPEVRAEDDEADEADETIEATADETQSGAESTDVRADDDEDSDEETLENSDSEERAMNVAEIRTAERERIRAIRTAAQKVRLNDPALVDRLIEEGVDLDGPEGARAQILDAAAAQAEATGPKVTSVTAGGQDEVETRCEGISEALMKRAFPETEVTERAKAWMGMSLPEMAREYLRQEGVDTRGMGKAEIAERAMNPRSSRSYGTRVVGGHTTSDFPLIMADVTNKSLQRGYDETPRTFTAWAQESTAADFKTKYNLRLGEAGDLNLVNESGEFENTTISETQESYAVNDYGRMISLTRKTIINDDLGAFTRVPQLLGVAGARRESDIVYDLLLTGGVGATMTETGNPLFHVDHNNVVAAGAAPSVASLSATRLLMNTQTGLDGTLIDIMEGFLLAPMSLKTEVEQLLGDRFIPVSQATSTPSSMLSLVPVFERRLDASTTPDAWYLIAARMHDTVEYSYLEGERGVQTFTREGWRVDGIEVKARMTFGAGLLDYRTFVQNPG